MNVPVKKVTIKRYDELLKNAEGPITYVQVPSSNGHSEFNGFMDKYKREIFISWPVDRPMSAQIEFSNKYECGFPSISMVIETKPKHLNVVKGNK